MNIFDTRLYRIVEVSINFFLLNLMWLVACIPIFTIYPATTAMFGVVREWVKGREPGLFRTFFSCFRANFKQSFWIGIVWTAIGAFVLANFALVKQMPSYLQFPLYVWFTLVVITHIFASVYLFPVVVNYEMSWTNVLKNSFLLCISQLPTTLQCVLVLGASTAIVLYFPIALLVLGSVTSYAIYWLCDRTFQRVESLKGDGGKSY